jgi:hypothetical protein
MAKEEVVGGRGAQPMEVTGALVMEEEKLWQVKVCTREQIG